MPNVGAIWVSSPDSNGIRLWCVTLISLKVIVSIKKTLENSIKGYGTLDLCNLEREITSITSV